ncbi:hypothetical protein SS50377_22848 [Spironucleus salmonicida]|uniref:Uncharacterized protein n=1 Tax=Spironucleus salmonicida TaxID=348837 RepID=V6LW23_9EUKA|nr:hypothetical protein SS50377_22848 [Spironucleus salmonicida]|eukprot:EST47906.1 Hypothetical protein SS50377_12010 [Spironucleus salmonicida]
MDIATLQRIISERSREVPVEQPRPKAIRQKIPRTPLNFSGCSQASSENCTPTAAQLHALDLEPRSLALCTSRLGASCVCLERIPSAFRLSRAQLADRTGEIERELAAIRRRGAAAELVRSKSLGLSRGRQRFVEREARRAK